MPSSTSSSRRRVTSRPGADRLTASDRPGVAQPVPERPVPDQPWRTIALCVLLSVIAATAAWEWRMRQLALLPGDIEDGPSAWAEQRRRIDTGDVGVAIVGDSRILFGTDPDRFETLTGMRPLQLSMVATNALFLLEDIARDPDFHGLLIVGITDISYFRKDFGRGADALQRYRFESPAQRSAQALHVTLSKELGFLDDSYRLSRLVARLDTGWRAGASGPYDEVWKIPTMHGERDTKMWSRIEQPSYLREHARRVWLLQRRMKPVDDGLVADTLRRTRDAVARIRAHGGDVVFLRPPSAGPLREVQDKLMPRQRGWDPLLRTAEVQGVHFEDDPAMQGLELPEYSHVTAACATVYTDAYVRALARITPRIVLRAGAPARLLPADCIRPPGP